MLVDRLGWDASPFRPASNVEAIQGLVGLSQETSKPIVLAPGCGAGRAERFLLARGAFLTLAASVGQGRLLTRAVTRQQRAGRAFAVELLAPASMLAKIVSGIVTADQVAELSKQFGVNPMLIEHQLENHGIGSVAA